MLSIIKVKRIISFLSVLFLFTLPLKAQDQLLVPFQSDWKYLDDGSDQGVAWRNFDFDDSSWASGPAMLGFGYGEVNTIVSYGSDPDEKHITTYFRHHFTIADASFFKNYLIKLRKDDGALIYVNGQEVMRSNFGDNDYDFDDDAYSSITSEEREIVWQKLIPPSFFQTGENVIAVEVHQDDGDSVDLLFDLELFGFDSVPALYREPYLQKSTTEGTTIKWVTDVPTDSKVWYGTTLNDLSYTVETSDLTTNHEVNISGLETNMKYFYKVGNSETEFIGGTSEFFFTTNPAIGTSQPTRIWITGDAGTGKDEQKFVRDSYLNFMGSNGKSDLWLMMGDNAYEHGRESDYHMGLFTVYQDVLKNTVSFPTTGNHDLLADASAFTEKGTYYDVFALPREGECGGLASGTESYYSLDYGNIHIICLESYDLNRDSTGAMATWLKADLQQTDADWLIAYWHFAPYTKVGHNSDDNSDFDGRHIEMRKQINPILEQHGIDLVLSGHSHGYERSFLIDGHYGFSNSLTDEMILDGTSGNLYTTGAYHKPKNLVPHKGTVYLVCGSSGKLSSVVDEAPLPGVHPAMYETNTDFAGSVILDLVGDTLEGKFLNEMGIIQDYFHIVKENPNSVTTISDPLQLNFYPNPASDQVNLVIENNSNIKHLELEFYTTDGKLAQTISYANLNPGKEQRTIPIHHLATGIYTVKIIADDTHVNSKMLVVK